MAHGRLAQPVEMFVRPKEHRLSIELNASLFTNLADRGLDQRFGLFNTARWNLRSSFGIIPMIKDENTVFSLDVDDNSVPQQHSTIVGRFGPNRRMREFSGVSPDRTGVSPDVVAGCA